jgi:hypothetical protein
LVPYGKRRFDKFVSAVRRFQHPYWKTEEMNFEYETHFNWNFWLDRYVQKFCRNGKLDPAIIRQRSETRYLLKSSRKSSTLMGLRSSIMRP